MSADASRCEDLTYSEALSSIPGLFRGAAGGFLEPPYFLGRRYTEPNGTGGGKSPGNSAEVAWMAQSASDGFRGQ
jgi:hypothetical protein